MPAFTDKSLRHKLLFWILILLLPVLILITFRSYFAATLFTNKANDRALFRMGLAIANQIKEDDGKINLTTNADKLIDHNHEEAVYYLILDNKHQVITGEKGLTQPKIFPSVGGHLFYTTHFKDEKIRILALHLPLMSNKNYASVNVLVGEKTMDRSESLQEIIIFFIITQIFVMLIAFFSVSYGIKRGLRPLEKLTKLINSRKPWETAPIQKANIPVEIQPLIDAMNDLFKKVKDSVKLKQQFIDNAAHQIKTPISGLKLQAESALKANDPDYIKHTLKQIFFVSNNLARLTQQLLSLARAESLDENKTTFTSTDLIALTQEIVAEWVPEALKKNIDLGVNFNCNRAIINGDAILLRELLNNLIDNAIRYNPQRTSINVSINGELEKIILSVEDNGVGIPEAEQKKVFQRFYRPIKTIETGCGLGLSIVEEIAKQHHTEVNLGFSDIKQQKGLCIKIRFNQDLSNNFRQI